VITPSSTLSEKHKKKTKVIGSSEPKKSQRDRKEIHLQTNFIFIDSILFLVKSDRNTILKQTLIS
jgi:hypothetical protein